MIDSMWRSLDAKTSIIVIAVAGTALYVYSVRNQSKKQKSLNPKKHIKYPKQSLGLALNNLLSKNWIKIDKQHNPKGIFEKRVI